MKKYLSILVLVVGLAFNGAAGFVASAHPVGAAAPEVHFVAAYPSDCFHRVVSWTYDYATGTCGYVPSGASFVELADCRDSWHTFTIPGFRQWTAYRNSTASCPGDSQMIRARISLTPS